MDQQNSLNSILHKVTNIPLKWELLAILFTGVAAGLVVAQLAEHYVLVIGASTLAIFYVLKGKSPTEVREDAGIPIFIYRLMNFSHAVCIVGILYWLSSWPGSGTMLVVGLMGSVISIGFGLYQRIKGENMPSQIDLIRAGFWLLCTALVLVV